MLTKQEIVQNFILNAEKERVRRNLTQAQMAKKLEMSLSGYKKMVAGSTTKIDMYTVYLLHVLSGKWIFELIDERPREAAFVSKLKEMTPNQINFVDSLVEFEIAFSDSITASEKTCDDYITVFIPTGNMEDGMIYDSTHYMKVDVSAYRQKFGNDMHCGLLVTSSHLHPVYSPGDILLICRKPMREGDTGIFFNRESGRMYIRKFHSSVVWALEPINNYGQTIYIDTRNPNEMKKWIGFGYVLSKMRQ